jgi:hypothetical protein
MIVAAHAGARLAEIVCKLPPLSNPDLLRGRLLRPKPGRREGGQPPIRPWRYGLDAVEGALSALTADCASTWRGEQRGEQLTGHSLRVYET